MHASMIYAVALGGRLRDKVYEDIVPRLSVAVADQLVERGYTMDSTGLDLAYQLTLRIFFRMLFQTYAEDRKLLPFGENEKYDRNALKTLALDFVENPDLPFDANSTSLWDDLAQVWRVIDKGDKAWGVPAYNGGLFASDSELNEHGAIIETLAITNDVVGPCLKALLLDESDDGEFGPIDFRSLSVREFGTIYEGLLESNLSVADVDLTLDDKDTWIPAREGDDVKTKAGEVYFHNTSGQRKGTGSYYTPTFVVEHILKCSLDPALDYHLAKVARFIDAGDQAGAAELFFDFRVADLAMGSGHFLTAAIDHIEMKMAAFLEEGHQVPGVTKEIILLGNAARDAIGDPEGPLPEGSSLLRRQIARRCIYGLDINPISVELARVAIWIHTFVRGLPMSSLDHNLVCANSLTGIGRVEESLDGLVPGRNGSATLFDSPIEEALKSARQVLADIAGLSEIDRRETLATSRAIKKARQEAQNAKLMFDAVVVRRLGRTDLVDGMDPSTIVSQAAIPEVQGLVKQLAPGHMPVLFPEVFLREQAGFDVLIGNPPWDKLRHEPTQFWVQKAPGLLQERDREARIEELRIQYPGYAQEEKNEIAARELLRVVLSESFELQGTGHLELAKFFTERNLSLLAGDGRMGIVLPGAFASLGGWKKLRLALLGRGFIHLTQSENRNGFLFPNVHFQTTVVTLTSAAQTEASVLVQPGLNSAEGFRSTTDGEVELVDLIDLEDDGQIPWLGSAESASVFSTITSRQSLSSGKSWIQGDVDTRWDFSGSGRNRASVSEKETVGSWRVMMTRHVLEYEIDDDDYRRFVSPEALRDLVTAGSLKTDETTGDPCLPDDHPRIVYRFPSRASDTRTLIATLIPKSGYFFSTGYEHGIRVPRGTTEDSQLALLALMNSIPADWWARRLVDRHVGARIIRRLPIPNLTKEQQLRLASLAKGILSLDYQFGTVVDADGERSDNLAEIDAIVAHGYGLHRADISHLFETFHRGWDFAPRLAKVLEYFDAIEEKS